MNYSITLLSCCTGEGIINSFRHGNATEIKITFWKDPDFVKIIIWDNGHRSTDDIKLSYGIGIQGIKDRINVMDGTFTANNVANGYEISVLLPYKGKNEYQNNIG